MGSYKANGGGKEDALVTPNSLYLKLGESDESRQATYFSPFKGHIPAQQLSDICNAWQTATPLGDTRFGESFEKCLKLKVGQDRSGRPKRALTTS
ncbi:MAG: hypothetical protein DRQ52_12260 [Gammaproteobacteria bacterium]|nr:MAG: hypothetical protein DRQ52_12260 [Gammaproteobacteria bacterium]